MGTGPAATALSEVRGQIADIRRRIDREIHQRDFAELADARTGIARLAASLPPLETAARIEGQQELDAGWDARQAEVLKAVRAADGEVLDAFETARTSLAQLVAVTDRRTAILRDHIADNTRPGRRPYERHLLLRIGHEQLHEVAAGDLVISLLAAGLDQCAGTPWGELRRQCEFVAVNVRLPERPA